jgi:hypothetical protein
MDCSSTGGASRDVAVLIGEHRKGRDDVLLEILVLVVAEHDDDIGLEVIKRAPCLGKMPAEYLTRFSR